MFLQPEVSDAKAVDLKWGDCDEEGLKQFLVKEKVGTLHTRGREFCITSRAYTASLSLLAQGFDVKRVESGIVKLRKARAGGVQVRMDMFFAPASREAVPSAPTGVKKAKEAAAEAKAKAEKASRAAKAKAAREKSKGSKPTAKEPEKKAPEKVVAAQVEVAGGDDDRASDRDDGDRFEGDMYVAPRSDDDEDDGDSKPSPKRART